MDVFSAKVTFSFFVIKMLLNWWINFKIPLLWAIIQKHYRSKNNEERALLHKYKLISKLKIYMFRPKYFSSLRYNDQISQILPKY